MKVTIDGITYEGSEDKIDRIDNSKMVLPGELSVGCGAREYQ